MEKTLHKKLQSDIIVHNDDINRMSDGHMKRVTGYLVSFKMVYYVTSLALNGSVRYYTFMQIFLRDPIGPYKNTLLSSLNLIAGGRPYCKYFEENQSG